MGAKFGGYEFDGPFISAREIFETVGVYVVQDSSTGSLIDMGESLDLKRTIDRSSQRNFWAEATQGNFVFWIRYTPDEKAPDRHKILSLLKFLHANTYLNSLR